MCSQAGAALPPAPSSASSLPPPARAKGGVRRNNRHRNSIRRPEDKCHPQEQKKITRANAEPPARSDRENPEL